MQAEQSNTARWSNDYPQQHSKRMDYRLLPATDERGPLLVGIDSVGVERMTIDIPTRSTDPSEARRIVQAMLCQPANKGDITSMCLDLASIVADGPGERSEIGYGLRDTVAEALDTISFAGGGQLGQDACGVVDPADGESDRIAWWHTNGYTIWQTVADCDADQLTELGVDAMGDPIED